MAKKVIVVGGGPVGSLAALYAAKRGYEVELHELRKDPRNDGTTPLNFTKSINLALSERGIHAIRSAKYDGLLDTILSQTVPMYGRMIHSRSNTGALQEQSQAYDVHGRFQRSADRGGLNICLLDELDKLPNVQIYFQHKLTGADFKRKKAWFEKSAEKAHPEATRPKEIEVEFDLMIGCDGAHSAVRFHMAKYALLNYTQEYIDCLWCEFTMPPSASGEYQISPNHLHIWPAGTFMFIALPNLDKSFVCTLFGPVSLFDRLETATEDDFVTCFDKYFPGITGLISKQDLHSQFSHNPHLPLIHIRCAPYHYKDSAVILGDAANAMVPFYGQGMNAGLESVRVFFKTLDRFGDDDTAVALAEYTKLRTDDAHAVATLALGNYTEMSSSVTSPWYKIRKYIEETLYKYVPQLGWATQYSRVSFSNMRYSDVVSRSRRQKRILQSILVGTASVSIATVVYLLGFGLRSHHRYPRLQHLIPRLGAGMHRN